MFLTAIELTDELSLSSSEEICLLTEQFSPSMLLSFIELTIGLASPQKQTSLMPSFVET